MKARQFISIQIYQTCYCNQFIKAILVENNIVFINNNITVMDNTEYYNILELQRDSSQKDIASAFRRLALKWHPKLSKADPNTSYSNLCKVSEAYEVLADQQRKTIYDKYGQTKLKQGVFEDGSLKGGYKFAGNPEQIFEQFFGTKNPYQPLFDKQSNKEARSVFSSLYPEANIDSLKDLVVKVNCTLSQQFNGCRKKVSYPKQILNKDGRTTNQIVQTKQIEIKAGMSQKNRIVLKGQGHQQAGISNSDLIFQIQQVSDSCWKRNGSDLIYYSDISLLDALSSKPFTITTLDGKQLYLAFDEVITPQTVRQIPNQGFIVFRQNRSPSQSYKAQIQRGNLLVRFNIKFPQSLQESQKKMLRQILTPK